MNYINMYEDLMRKRCMEPLDPYFCYCEKHHRIPRSWGGKDYGDNIVYLTAREHYIAHCLLWKATKKDLPKHDQMKNAVRLLFHSRWNGRNPIIRRQRFFRCNHWLYSRISHGRQYIGERYKCDNP